MAHSNLVGSPNLPEIVMTFAREAPIDPGVDEAQVYTQFFAGRVVADAVLNEYAAGAPPQITEDILLTTSGMFCVMAARRLDMNLDSPDSGMLREASKQRAAEYTRVYIAEGKRRRLRVSSEDALELYVEFCIKERPHADVAESDLEVFMITDSLIETWLKDEEFRQSLTTAEQKGIKISNIYLALGRVILFEGLSAEDRDDAYHTALELATDFLRPFDMELGLDTD